MQLKPMHEHIETAVKPINVTMIACVRKQLTILLNSRFVIPLKPTNEVDDKIAKKLCPVITVEDKDYVLGSVDHRAEVNTKIRNKLT